MNHEFCGGCFDCVAAQTHTKQTADIIDDPSIVEEITKKLGKR